MPQMGENIKNTWEMADQHFKTSDSLGVEDELMVKKHTHFKR